MKLGLGTVQWGQSYGIANVSGRPSDAAVTAILAVAARHGIEMLDTAPSYGDSEEVIGRCRPADTRFALVTKTPRIDGGDGVETMRTAFAASLARLGLARVHGLLVHRAEDLLGPQGEALWDAMTDLKRQGRVAKIGASVYTAAHVEALEARFPLDILQVPLSLFDQRLIDGGHLDRLHRQGIELHARSVFLQGLMLMPPDSLPEGLARFRSHVADYRERLDELGLSPLAAALRFAVGRPEIDVVLCGVERPHQLEEIVVAAEGPPPDASLNAFAVTDERLVNPSLWPKVH